MNKYICSRKQKFNNRNSPAKKRSNQTKLHRFSMGFALYCWQVSFVELFVFTFGCVVYILYFKYAKIFKRKRKQFFFVTVISAHVTKTNHKHNFVYTKQALLCGNRFIYWLLLCIIIQGTLDHLFVYFSVYIAYEFFTIDVTINYIRHFQKAKQNL